MKYTYNQLQTIKLSIEQALKEKLNKDERYGFLKNLKKVKQALDIEEGLRPNVEKWDEYQQKRFNLLVECGAEAKPSEGGGAVITSFENLDEEKVNKELEKLNKEYKETIEEQNEVIKENNEFKLSQEFEVDWHKISFDKFSDDTNEKILNENTIDFVE